MANWIKRIFLLTKPSLDNPTDPDKPIEEYSELIDDYDFLTTTIETNKNWVATTNGVIKFPKQSMSIGPANAQAIYTINKNIVGEADYQLTVTYFVYDDGRIVKNAIMGVREFKDTTLLATHEFNSTTADDSFIKFKSSKDTNKFEVYTSPIPTKTLGTVGAISFKRV